ncbi:sulfotransferase family protein [Symbioplanes lichenis]|uniref:sulfotransferase family protein n=1 Tax=Symbioplanes lichenis TaxID=1629072 RepID=UPI00273A4CD6|nr:sulfotransferase family protein [Actinoplanes lichenis]
MDVIGVGFGRTGTLSLKVALERLGFGPCLHMLPLFDDPERAALFGRAAEGDPGALEAAVAGYRSTVDWPGAYFWRELVAGHPRAKVILTVREPDKWYRSAWDTIYQGMLRTPDPSPTLRMARTIVWGKTFGNRFEDRERAIKTFQEHNAAVRREVPAPRLLEFRVRDGWQPLCDFLGEPVPGEPFPHVNDTASFCDRRFSAPAGRGAPGT